MDVASMNELTDPLLSIYNKLVNNVMVDKYLDDSLYVTASEQDPTNSSETRDDDGRSMIHTSLDGMVDVT